MKVMIACGGTGWHLFPGLAVAEVLQARHHQVRLLVSERAIDQTALAALTNSSDRSDGIAVEVERLTEEEGVLVVDAAIWVDREGQKPIVIGAHGERLKRVGRAARLALNQMLGRRLHLNLWVKVRENWADNARALRELGVE